MFGALGDLASLMKQAKSMQENMQKLQESLAEQRYEAEAGAGMVRAVVNGKSELVDIKIDPKAAGVAQARTAADAAARFGAEQRGLAGCNE